MQRLFLVRRSLLDNRVNYFDLLGLFLLFIILNNYIDRTSVPISYLSISLQLNKIKLVIEDLFLYRSTLIVQLDVIRVKFICLENKQLQLLYFLPFTRNNLLFLLDLRPYDLLRIRDQRQRRSKPLYLYLGLHIFLLAHLQQILKQLRGSNRTVLLLYLHLYQ